MEFFWRRFAFLPAVFDSFVHIPSDPPLLDMLIDLAILLSTESTVRAGLEMPGDQVLSQCVDGIFVLVAAGHWSNMQRYLAPEA